MQSAALAPFVATPFPSGLKTLKYRAFFRQAYSVLNF
jgi:hypothetical protein